MNPSLRLVAVMVALVVPALALGRWTIGTASLPRVGTVELSLPAEIGPWTAVEDTALEEDVLAMIDPDGYIMRRYEAPGRPPVWVFYSLYGRSLGDGRRAHSPEVCYPSQGWEIMANRRVAIAVAPSETLIATELETQHGLREEQVVFWFQPADRWPAGPLTEQWGQFRNGLNGRLQYAFVRLSVSGGKEVAGSLRELAPAIAVTVREDVDSL